MNQTLLLVIQIIVSGFLIAVILLQSQGGGLTQSLSGRTGFGAKRGVEKIVFRATIVLAVLFLILSLVNAFVG